MFNDDSECYSSKQEKAQALLNSNLFLGYLLRHISRVPISLDVYYIAEVSVLTTTARSISDSKRYLFAKLC